MSGSVLERKLLNWLYSKLVNNLSKFFEKHMYRCSFLVKLQDSSLQLYWKIKSLTVISQWLCLDFWNTFFSEPLLMVVCNSSEINISPSLWFISYTKSYAESSKILLHSVGAIKKRTIVCGELAFSKKLYRIDTSQCKCKSIDRFLYDTSFYWKVFLNRL